MPSGAVNLALSLVGWATIPDRLTTYLIPIYHKHIARRPGPPPPIGTVEYWNIFRRTYAFVIVSYLLFTLYQAASSQEPNFYQLLNVGVDVDENGLKAAFRKFARRHHPDKVGIAGEALFMRVRDAYEALKDPTKRFAYERFGPDALTWENVITPKEYMHSGLMHASGFYIGTFFMMLVWAILGESDSGTIWRFLLFFYIMFTEFAMCIQSPPMESSSSSATDNMFPIRSSLPFALSVLRFIFPGWIPYQHVSFLHQLYIALSIAIARVGPVVWPDSGNAGGMTAREELAWKGVVQKLVALTANADNEVARILQTELTAIQGVADPPRPAGGIAPYPKEEIIRMLESEMATIGIDALLLNNPSLRELWQEAILRKRQEAATGLRSPPDEDPDADRATVVGDHEQSPADEPSARSLPPSPSLRRSRLSSPPASPIMPLSPTILTHPSPRRQPESEAETVAPLSPRKISAPDLPIVTSSSTSNVWVKAMSVEGGSM